MPSMTPFRRVIGSLRRLFSFDSSPAQAEQPHRPVEAPGLDRADQVRSRSPVDYYRRLQLGEDRIEVYAEMRELDLESLPSELVNTVAEEATQPDPFMGRRVWVEAPENPALVDILEKWQDRVDLDEQSPGIVRAMALMGDDFEQLITRKKEGIVALEYVEPEYVEKRQNDQGQCTGWSIFDTPIPPGRMTINYGQHGMTPQQIAQPWDIVHFMVRGRRRRSERHNYGQVGVVYGEPYLFSVRRPWTRYSLMEDAMVLYRYLRQPQRLAYKIDTTGQNPGAAWNYVHLWKQQLRSKKFWSEDLQQLAGEIGDLAYFEDLFIPVVKDSVTDITPLPATANVGDVFDIELVQRMVFAAARQPKEFYGIDSEGWDQNKALSQKDIRFSHLVIKYQRAYAAGVHRMMRIQLALTGFDPTLPKNQFSVHMSPVSLLDEQARVELYKLRIEVINQLFELGERAGFDKDRWHLFVIRTFGGFPAKVSREMLKTAKPEPGAAAGGLGAGLGGELGAIGGELGAIGGELGGEMGAPAEGGAEAEIDLSAPAPEGGEEISLEGAESSAVSIMGALRSTFDRERNLTERHRLRDGSEQDPLPPKDAEAPESRAVPPPIAWVRSHPKKEDQGR